MTFEDGQIICNLKELQATWGVTATTIANYLAEGMPKVAHGKYDLVACWKWKEQKLIEKYSRTKEVVDYQAELAELTKLKKEEKLLELEQRRGELVPMDAAKQMLSTILAAAKAKMLGRGTRIASVIMGARSINEVKKILDDDSEQFLRTLIGDLRQGTGATKEDDSEPVGGQLSAVKHRKLKRARPVED